MAAQFTQKRPVTHRLRVCDALADDAGDEPTADLLTQRMQLHEKTAWMLRSLLASQAGRE